MDLKLNGGTARAEASVPGRYIALGQQYLFVALYRTQKATPERTKVYRFALYRPRPNFQKISRAGRTFTVPPPFLGAGAPSAPSPVTSLRPHKMD